MNELYIKVSSREFKNIGISIYVHRNCEIGTDKGTIMDNWRIGPCIGNFQLETVGKLKSNVYKIRKTENSIRFC